MLKIVLMAASLLGPMERNGIEISVNAEPTTIDPGRSVFLTVTLKSPKDIKALLPDLHGRVRGLTVADDYEDDPYVDDEGRTVQTARWKLVPEPCAEEYRVAPFVVKASPVMLSSRADDGRYSFYVVPKRFDPPAPREPVGGEIETNPTKDLPPLSWSLVGLFAGALAGVVAIAYALLLGIRYVSRRVKEHLMSPIERAWVELDRLLKKGLPGRGRYKDFYVELTMVVRRYVQRKYGIRAPHMTTDEFLRECGGDGGKVCGTEALKKFLESADMVKFAGVEATPEMADEATDSARGYLKSDSAEERK